MKTKYKLDIFIKQINLLKLVKFIDTNNTWKLH